MTSEETVQSAAPDVATGQPSTQLRTTTAQSTSASQNEPGSATEEYAQDIVVTAQFRAQNLQQTPLAITAISGDQLRQKGIVNTQDLARVAPSVSLRHTGTAGGKTLAAFIRGVGASDYSFGIEPGVAFYIDDVYLGPSYGTLLDFIDLERAEVLRGPQGTLSGKNAIGGAIRLVTVKPTGKNDGYIDVETGSRRLLRVRAAYDISLVPDTLSMRVSGYSASQNGLVKLLDFACVNPTLLGDQSAPHSLRDTSPGQSCQRGSLGDTDEHAGRVQFRWTPSDNLEVNLAGDYIDDKSGAAPDVLLSVDPSGFASYRSPLQPANTPPYFVYNYGVPYDQRFLPPNRYSSYATFDDTVYGLKFAPKNTLLTKDVTLNVDYKFSPTLSLKSITAYREISGIWANDTDSSPLGIDTFVDNQSHRQFSQELRLSGTNLGDRLNWTIGGFYYDAKERDIGTVGTDIYNLFVKGDSRPKSTNYAAFVHAEFKLTDKLTLIGGLRQSHESKVYRFVSNDIAGTPSMYWPGGLDFPARTKYDRTDYRAAVQYQITPEHMVYADVATGFRGGGFNPRPTTVQRIAAFSPESQTTYEVGQRSELFDRRVRWNNTFYYSKFNNIILQGRANNVTPGGTYLVTIVTNAAKAHIYGWESELQADVNKYLSFNGAASYTKFKYDDLGIAAPLAATSGPTLDSTQRYTPKWKFSAGIQATIPILEDLGKLTLNADYSYQSKQYSDIRNYEELKIDAYGVANARLTFATLENGWSISGIVTNLFNEKYFYNKSYQTGNYVIKGNPAPGAEWSLSLRKKF